MSDLEPGPMDGARLVFESVGLRTGAFSATFAPGVHLLLGDSASAGEVLLLASGQVRAPRGRVTLDGVDPHSSPSTRARIATTSPAPLPGGGDVTALIDAVTHLRGQPSAAAHALLRSWQAESLLRRATHELRPDEAALVDLALALSHTRAALLALWRPFATRVDQEWLRDTLERHGQERIVLVGEHVLPEPATWTNVLHFGTSSEPGAANSTSLATPTVRLWLGTDDVEGVAEALLRVPGARSAEVLRGSRGLVCLTVAREPPTAVRDVLLAAQSLAEERGLTLYGMRLEREAP